jgi:hypothetical protein
LRCPHRSLHTLSTHMPTPATAPLPFPSAHLEKTTTSPAHGNGSRLSARLAAKQHSANVRHDASKSILESPLHQQ